MQTSPLLGSSGVPRLAVTGAVELPDFRPMLLPGKSKPRGVPRDSSIDNLFRKVRDNDARPHEHVPRILYYRRHVLGEPLEQVLMFPYATISWMQSLETRTDSDVARALAFETQRECTLNLAQIALIDEVTGPAVQRYLAASAQYRAALDVMDATVMAAARMRRCA